MKDYIVFYKDYADRVVSRAIFSARDREDAEEQARNRQPDAEYWLRIETDDKDAEIGDFDVDELSDWVENRKQAWNELRSRRCGCCGTDFSDDLDEIDCPDCRAGHDDDHP